MPKRRLKKYNSGGSFRSYLEDTGRLLGLQGFDTMWQTFGGDSFLNYENKDMERYAQVQHDIADPLATVGDFVEGGAAGGVAGGIAGAGMGMIDRGTSSYDTQKGGIQQNRAYNSWAQPQTGNTQMAKYGGRLKKLKGGGNIAGDSQKGIYVDYNVGQSHGGPDEGIEVDSMGQPVAMSGGEGVGLTEKGEVTFNGDVFSDSVKLPGNKKRTFADEAKRITRKYKFYLGEKLDKQDEASKLGLQKELQTLFDIQEAKKGRMMHENDVEQLLEEQQQAQAQMVQQEQMAEQPPGQEQMMQDPAMQEQMMAEQMGGGMPMMQDGGSLDLTSGLPSRYVKRYNDMLNKHKTNEPIFVTDPNDPRLRAYNDSLWLHEKNKMDSLHFWAKDPEAESLRKETHRDLNFIRDDKGRVKAAITNEPIYDEEAHKWFKEYSGIGTKEEYTYPIKHTVGQHNFLNGTDYTTNHNMNLGYVAEDTSQAGSPYWDETLPVNEPISMSVERFRNSSGTDSPTTQTTINYAKPKQPYILKEPPPNKNKTSINKHSNNEITTKQKELKDLGFYDGIIDGIWGDKSKAALKEYENSKIQEEGTKNIPQSIPQNIPQSISKNIPQSISNNEPTIYEGEISEEDGDAGMITNRSELPGYDLYPATRYARSPFWAKVTGQRYGKSMPLHHRVSNWINEPIQRREREQAIKANKINQSLDAEYLKGASEEDAKRKRNQVKDIEQKSLSKTGLPKHNEGGPLDWEEATPDYMSTLLSGAASTIKPITGLLYNAKNKPDPIKFSRVTPELTSEALIRQGIEEDSRVARSSARRNIARSGATSGGTAASYSALASNILRGKSRADTESYTREEQRNAQERAKAQATNVQMGAQQEMFNAQLERMNEQEKKALYANLAGIPQSVLADIKDQEQFFAGLNMQHPDLRYAQEAGQPWWKRRSYGVRAVGPDGEIR